MNISSEILAKRRVWARQAVEFVRSIGLQVREAVPTDSLEKAFTPYILIEAGGLIVDCDNVFPGDVLHEAGHLATIPAPFRHLAAGGLAAVKRHMAEYLDAHPDGLMSWPEDPVCRGIMQCDDGEATAWQYAAAQHIGLPDKWLFPPGSFNGRAADTLEMLKLGGYLGINGLQAAKWTSVRPSAKLPHYPKLAFWIHGAAAA